MTRFCLVRHGQTAWNLEGRYQGQSDIPLNAAGLEQARELARTLQNVRFDAVYSSDLVRALETANTIIALHDHLQVHVDPRLREINQGEWEGVQIEEIRTQYAHLWQARQVDPVNLRPPGGETVGEVFQRMHSALDEIARLFKGETFWSFRTGLPWRRFCASPRDSRSGRLTCISQIIPFPSGSPGRARLNQGEFTRSLPVAGCAAALRITNPF